MSTRPLELVRLLLLCVALAGCDTAPEAARGRVLLVGVDGASPALVRRLLGERALPNLAALAHEGVHGRLRPSLPLWSPRIWTSIATGKPPDEHGIEGFARETPGGRRLFTSADRKVPALWNIASAAGLAVGVVNWWTSYPPERIRGVMVTDHLIPGEVAFRRNFLRIEAPPDAAAIVFPEEWAERIDRVVQAWSSPDEARADPFAAERRLPAWVPRAQLSAYWREDELVARLALEIEAHARPDVLMVFLPGVDRVSHWLWGALEPPEVYPEVRRFSGGERDAAASALLATYRHADALVGQLLERYGAEDLVVVVSDHGFEPGVDVLGRTGKHETEVARDGVLFVRGPGVVAASGAGDRPAEEPVIRDVDVTPTILAWLGRPVAEDMAGRPPPFLHLGPGSTIASYDEIAIERVEAPASGAETEMLERLRAVGYIE